MFDKIDPDKVYVNPLVERKSYLFCPRAFTRDSGLPEYLVRLFPHVFTGEMPKFFNQPCITLYVILQLLFQHLKVTNEREFDLICIPWELYEILGIHFCTKNELKNVIKDHLVPLEHFELELFDPTGHYLIPKRESFFDVWNLKFMAKFPSNRRVLIVFVLSKLKFDLDEELKQMIENNEKRLDPSFRFTPRTAIEILELAIRLITYKREIYLDPSNVQVLIPPITWAFSPVQDLSVRANFIHVSDFPKRLFKLMTIYRF